MFAVLWLAIAAFGVVLIAMGVRVFVDEEWEDGDWWAFNSYLALRGLLFMFLFPTTRTPHTRTSERLNAAIVAAWGVLLTILGVGLCLYESTR